MTDCGKEFPKFWFKNAKLCHEFHDSKINFFKINASLHLSVWEEKGWIYHEDPKGCFSSIVDIIMTSIVKMIKDR